MKAYKKMGYDAVAVGPFDLAAGVGLLKHNDNQQLLWISANLVNNNNIPVFSPSIIKTIGQTRIAIVGLTNTTSFLPQDLHIVGWRTVLPALVKKLSSRCNHIILLSNLSNSENGQIARQFPSIDIIISADPRYTNFGPVINRNTLLVQTTGEGKFLGSLTVAWGKTAGWAIDRLGKASDSRGNLNTNSILSSFSARFIPLSQAIPESIEMNRFIQQLKHRINMSDR